MVFTSRAFSGTEGSKSFFLQRRVSCELAFLVAQWRAHSPPLDQRFESRFLQRRVRANLIAPRPGWCRISRSTVVSSTSPACKIETQAKPWYISLPYSGTILAQQVIALHTELQRPKPL